MQFTIIAAIMIATAGVAFAIQYNVPVTAVFIPWRFDVSLAHGTVERDDEPAV